MLAWVIGLPLIGAVLAPILHTRLRSATGYFLALIPVFLLTWLATRIPVNEPVSLVVPWSSVLAVQFALRLDGLSAAFVLLITAVGTLVIVYAAGYFGRDSRLGKFYSYLLLFMSAMLGVVLADDLITLFVFWELTSISSYLLIGFNHTSKASRDSALKALLTTGAGGLLLLAGLVLLSILAAQQGLPTVDSGRISSLLAIGPAQLPEGGLLAAAVVLILLGAFTKSAQFPFHYWLPGAMAAPTPVSAYLHSATMVKAGVYLLARFHPLLGELPLWHIAVTGVGAVTMVVTAVMAAGQRDLKRILAFTTVSKLGMLTMLLGIGTDEAIKAAVVLLVAHALYKAALFLVAGSVDHETGTRDVTQLGGLVRIMPITAAAAMVAALSKAGAPPLFGFVGKELLLKAKLALENDPLGIALIILATIANIFLVAVALIVVTWPFFGQRKETPKKPHEAPLAMLLGPVLLAALGLFVGILPGFFDATIGSAMASSIIGKPVEMKLKLWHGLSPDALLVLGISVFTLALGIALFTRFHILERAGAVLSRLQRYGPEACYEALLSGLLKGSALFTGLIQSGYLRRYILVAFASMILLVAYPLSQTPWSDLDPHHWDYHIYEVILAGLMLAGAAVTISTRSQLTAVAGLGVTGMAITLLFVVFSAPDLAITMVMVETLTVILLVFVLYHLPRLARLRSAKQRVRDAIVAGTGGLIMSLLILASASVDLPADVSRQLADNSVIKAYGRNVVNVILVDYRALDTLGEIVVVAVAGIGVYALLRLRPQPSEQTAIGTESDSSNRTGGEERS